jgi:hypothetical protein
MNETGEPRVGTSEGVEAEMRAWRRAHPQASFAEIEAAVEERLAAVRARLVAEAAGASAAADAEAQPACCPECGAVLQLRGQHTRAVTVRGGEAVRLARHYGVCLACGAGLFPPG